MVRTFTYDGHMTGAADKAVYDELVASGKAAPDEPEVLDCGKYAGMTTMEARKAILADLEEGGYIKYIELSSTRSAPATAAIRALSRWSQSSGSSAWSLLQSPLSRRSRGARPCSCPSASPRTI